MGAAFEDAAERARTDAVITHRDRALLEILVTKRIFSPAPSGAMVVLNPQFFQPLSPRTATARSPDAAFLTSASLHHNTILGILQPAQALRTIQNTSVRVPPGRPRGSTTLR